MRMAIFFALAGIVIAVAAFRLKVSPTLTGYGLLAACVCVVFAFSFWGAGGGCYSDWDGRSTATVCE